jgi:hypothetical protein
LGYATLSPQELPAQATSLPQGQLQLLNFLNQVESDRLMSHVLTLQNMGSRHVNSGYDRADWGIGAAYTYVEGQFQAIRAQAPDFFVFDQEFALNFAGIDSRPKNIIAVIQGTEIGAGTIIIGAHYDSITFDPEDGASLAPGADDNGSGIAALIELARVLSTRPHKASIMFVAFSAEEVGRKGSIAFVNDYIKARNIQVRAVLDMDIIGSEIAGNGAINDSQFLVYSTGPDQTPSRQLARTLNFLSANLASPLQVIVVDAEDRPKRYSDHMSFSSEGYPAVRFIEANEDPKRQHNAQDTIDRVGGGYLTHATQTILAVVTGLADGLQPPNNMVLRDMGNGLRKLVWGPIPGAVSYVVALRSPGSLFYNQQFETPQTSVEWDGFIPARYSGVAVAAKDANGLIGATSAEYVIS